MANANLKDKSGWGLLGILVVLSMAALVGWFVKDNFLGKKEQPPQIEKTIVDTTCIDTITTKLHLK